MYILLATIATVNLVALVTVVQYLVLSCRNPRLSPDVTEYCLGQYHNILGYHHSRLIHEYNKSFLPNTCDKTQLNQYQEFLKNVREKKVTPADFVNVSDETYPSPEVPSTSTTTQSEPDGLRQRSTELQA